MVLCAAGACAQETVYLLNGESLHGKVKRLDAWTIRVTSPQGVFSVPAAALVPADVARFAPGDRSEDARFWYERREAVRSAIAAEALRRAKRPDIPRDPEITRELSAADVQTFDLTEVMLETDRHRRLFPLWKEKLIAAERANAQHQDETAATKRGFMESLLAQDAEETRKRNAARKARLEKVLEELFDRRIALAMAMRKMHPGGPNHALAEIQLASLDRQIARITKDIAALGAMANDESKMIDPE